MAANGGSSKDATARRRRIAEKGSERMALITGRLRSIPSSPSSVAHSHRSYTGRLSDQLPPSDGITDSTLNAETAQHDVGNEVQPSMHECETITEATTHATLRPDEIQSFPIKLTDQTPSISASNNTQKPESQTYSTSNNTQKPESQTYLHKTLNPNQFCHAITSSQDTRTKCSFMAAILALLSQVELPILGSHITKSILFSRPLFLLLLTNITIVVAHLLLKAMEKVEQKKDSGSSTGFTDNLGKALDWGMLLVTGSSALFMDCSIYSVVVICGMSFWQKFQL